MRLIRILHILYILAKHRLDRFIGAHIPLWLTVVIKLVRLMPTPSASPAVSLRLAIEELGPIFIKFGQLLSTRRDLFSDEVTDELQKLQDQVPPFSSLKARQLIEAELNAPIENVFRDFAEEPLASASVAQIHTAKLATGEGVVIKIIRPDIESRIKLDIRIMLFIAHTLERFWREGRRLHPVEVVNDYEHTILNELNLQLEAANTATLRENWLNSNELYVPQVYWDDCSSNMMVMERIYGVHATDLDVLHRNEVDLRKLAHLGVNIFFTQVFEHNFFHADMHPGNVFIDITDPLDPTYIALDCAIIGSLTEDDKNYLAENLLAFFQQDYAKVAELHVASGWVPADTNVKDFESVIRSVCAPVFQKPIKDISFGKVLLSLFRAARQFEMEVQPQLVLLQKTLLNIEGMGRQIYPDLDLWETAAPYMENWMQERYGATALFKNVTDNAPRWLRQLPELPDLAIGALTELNSLGERADQQTKLLADIKHELNQQARRNRYTRIGGVALIAAILTSLLPLSGYASTPEALIGTSILGSLGLYWMYIQS
ncbi:MAG: ubiquinone biosynthesis regulatory protein kinase UbiB [Pseudomonadales bacterium]|nr:ubiquinone biosynthesis regulatory protein kinase UbiB [Pseudomonadales bacterium]